MRVKSLITVNDFKTSLLMTFPQHFYAKDEVGLYPNPHEFIRMIDADTAEYQTPTWKVNVRRNEIELYQLEYGTTLQATLNDLEAKVEKLKNIISMQ